MSTKIDLLPDEQVVMTSDEELLTLTTKRVRYHGEAFGTSRIISITLDAVASCGVITQRFPLFLLFAVVALIGAGFAPSSDAQTVLVGVGIVLIVAYFMARRGLISISSQGGDHIVVPTKGMSQSDAMEFVEAVEREKLG